MLKTEENQATNSTTIYLADYAPPDFNIDEVTMLVELDADELGTARITTTSQVRRTNDRAEKITLDGEKFELVSIALDGHQLADSEYVCNDHSLTIMNPPERFKLEVVCLVRADKNTELSGLYCSSNNYCTQCEAEGFRRITYFLDRPDVLSTYDVSIIGDQKKYPQLLSNGNLVAMGENQDGQHWARWNDPIPKPCYLFALVAGDLESISDSFTTASGKQISLNIYTQAHNIDKCDHAMQALKNSMTWDEENYGREYDLSIYNIVAVDDFNMGAMENKGLNIFNSKYVLADQQTATDTDFQGIESVIAHEYFHNWSGNRVTCRDWFQLSLKEGFTVYRDQEFSADMASPVVKRIRDVQALRTYQFKEDSGPMAHPVRPSSYQEINNFYTVTIYEKGAELIRMMQRLMGAQAFREGCDLYFDRFDGQAVTTDDFVDCMQRNNEINFEQFKRWYTQAGTPCLEVIQSFDAGKGRLLLEVTQTCPATPEQSNKLPFLIPVEVALLDQTGKKIEQRTLVLDKQYQSFSFDDLSEQPVVSFLRGFTAPVKVNFDRPDQDLVHLACFDDDGFSKWEAMQQLMLNALASCLSTIKPLEEEPAFQYLTSAISTLLEHPPEDSAMLAEMLTLPSNSYLAEQQVPIDPQAVVDAREHLQQRLAQAHKQALIGLYHKMCDDGEFSLSAEAMGRRALKSQALMLLMTLQDTEQFALGEKQYKSANNMTDRLAAFSALIHNNYPKRNELIADFYSEWQHDSLVMDKWFSMQATIPELKVLENLHTLMKHQAFSLRNPNKVRSLIGAFTSNMRAFHRSDGLGYQFIADMVLELDQINPQIAARLVSTFNNWRSFTQPYSQNMQSQLRRISEQASLSQDVSEIVSKALT